jgi:uncharacterized protein YnzC (UPF0291/DUF896 family)
MCFEGYIGLKHCSLEEPTSGLYVNDLAGITTELVAKVHNSDNFSFKEQWESIEKRSINRFLSDVKNIISDEYTFDEVNYQTNRITRGEASPVVVPATNGEIGTYLRLPRSKYATLNVKNIFVHSETELDTVTNYKIVDINTKKVLKSEEITVKKGYNIFNVDFLIEPSYSAIEVVVVVEMNFDSITTSTDYWEDCECRRPVSQVWPTNEEVVIWATEPTEYVYEYLNLTSEGKGVWVDAEILCSSRVFTCERKESLKLAYWYLLGVEVLNEKLNSNRLNVFSQTNVEQTTALRDDYQAQYLGSLKRTLKNIKINDSYCFTCKPQVNYGGMLP